MSESISFPIKAPAFVGWFQRAQASTRTCSHAGCDDPGGFIDGHYFVGDRRVRVWTCWEHWHGSTLRVLPTPPSIVAALEEEKRHIEQVQKRLRHDVDPDRGVSVKYLAPTGIGKAIPRDRVKSWRWNGY